MIRSLLRRMLAAIADALDTIEVVAVLFGLYVLAWASRDGCDETKDEMPQM